MKIAEPPSPPGRAGRGPLLLYFVFSFAGGGFSAIPSNWAASARKGRSFSASVLFLFIHAAALSNQRRASSLGIDQGRS